VKQACRPVIDLSSASAEEGGREGWKKGNGAELNGERRRRPVGRLMETVNGRR